MDSTSINQPLAAPVKKSRLPAGSTLEIAPGVHVPHPEAEPNRPGGGDPRLGETDAVTETVVTTDGVLTVDQKPLADQVRVAVIGPAPTVNLAPTTTAEAVAVTSNA